MKKYKKSNKNEAKNNDTILIVFSIILIIGIISFFVEFSRINYYSIVMKTKLRLALYI